MSCKVYTSFAICKKGTIARALRLFFFGGSSKRLQEIVLLLLGYSASASLNEARNLVDEVSRLLSGLKKGRFRFCTFSEETTLLCPARAGLLYFTTPTGANFFDLALIQAPPQPHPQ